MKLLVAERIKLFSTRSPYWCLAAILASALLFALLMSLITVNGHQFASTGTSQAGMQLGMMVFMVLAALTVTTEYRFGTIRTTFLTTPRRETVFGAKTAVVAVLAAVTAAVCGLAAFFLTKILASTPAQPLELSSGSDWRYVLGSAAIYPIAAVIALAVGALIRQSAGAIAILLVWPMLIEPLISIIPRVGEHIGPWLPFDSASAFVSDRGAFAAIGQESSGTAAANLVNSNAPTPLQGLLVFLGTAVVLWLIALLVLRRRDA